jgi:hypothetical protein
MFIASVGAEVWHLRLDACFVSATKAAIPFSAASELWRQLCPLHILEDELADAMCQVYVLDILATIGDGRLVVQVSRVRQVVKT